MMKKLIKTCLLLLSTEVMVAQAGAIKAGVSAFYNGDTEIAGIGGGFTLEFPFGQKCSFSAALDYTKGSGTEIEYFSNTIVNIPYKSQAVVFRPEFRFYPKQSLKGFFAGLGVNLGSYRRGYISGQNTATSPVVFFTKNEILLSPAMILGLNLQITSKFCAEISGGAGLTLVEDGGFNTFGSLRFGYSF